MPTLPHSRETLVSLTPHGQPPAHDGSTPAGAASSFDAQRPPSRELLKDCVHCGFCLPACPTYVLWGEEMDSPRGRIYMMGKASAGDAPLDATFQTHMDRCLGCMACMTACPSGVQYDKLIEDTRPQVERHVARPAGESLVRTLLFETFPYARRLRLLSLPLLAYQRSGLQAWVRRHDLLRRLPFGLAGRAQQMDALLPRVPATLFRKLPSHYPAAALSAPATGPSPSPDAAERPLSRTTLVPEQRPPARVALLTGCVQSVFFNRVNAATARVLAAEGCEVFLPPDQGCCGALMVHSGLDEQAMHMARRTIETFERAARDHGIETILVNAAGCGSTLKEYGHLLREDPVWAARAARFSSRCKDIAEFLATLQPRAPRHPLPLRVAYQDACHLRHAQGIFLEPRALLATIPGLELAELAEPDLCCGSAGVYNLLHPEPARELGDRKVQHLLDAGAEAVVSANPGCLLQLMSGLRRRGLEGLPAYHMVELLDASIRGITPQQLADGQADA